MHETTHIKTARAAVDVSDKYATATTPFPHLSLCHVLSATISIVNEEGCLLREDYFEKCGPFSLGLNSVEFIW